jgi:hypothetical protein
MPLDFYELTRTSLGLTLHHFSLSPTGGRITMGLEAALSFGMCFRPAASAQGLPDVLTRGTQMPGGDDSLQEQVPQ